MIEIFFEDSGFYPFILQQQLTTLDFVSYCGGYLGLFMGISLISIIEIIYFFIVKFLFTRSQSMIAPQEEVEAEKDKESYFSEVIRNLSIHGFNWTTIKNQHILERFEKQTQFYLKLNSSYFQNILDCSGRCIVDLQL